MDYRLFQDLNGLAARGGVFDQVVRFWASNAAVLFPAILVVLWSFPGKQAHRVRAAAVVAAASALVALAANQVLNHLVDRARPYAAHSGVHLLLARSGDASFPSDHTAVAFAVAVALWRVRPRLGAVLAVLGALLGVSRIVAGVHYPTDVLGGATVGALGALTVWWLGARPVDRLTTVAERVFDAALSPIRRLRRRPSLAD